MIYISCKWLINILFGVCKLFVWISASCWDVAKKFNYLVYNVFHIAENIFLVNVSNVLKSVWRFYFEWAKRVHFEWAILQIAGNHICDFLKRVHFEWAKWIHFEWASSLCLWCCREYILCKWLINILFAVCMNLIKDNTCWWC